MSQIYFCISIIVFSIALSVGLVSGIYFRPPEIYTDREIYLLAGKIATGVILLALGIIILLIKNGCIKIEKGLAKRLGGEK